MKSVYAGITVSCLLAAAMSDMANAAMVKMCLFYKPSGHARTDPILSQDCVSDHVHTFYGPQLFHPSTTNADLRNSDPRYSTSPWVENKSLYWHPSIYKVGQDTATGLPTYELADVAFSGPYYRWDKAAPAPAVEAFPPGFQMIAGMDPNMPGVNLFSECLCPKPCTRADGLCNSDSTFFPSDACSEMGIAMAFPTCWDDSKGLGDTGDHMSHMAYTVDGTVEGACPEGYNRRLPQIQLFVRIHNYEGGKYTFSDNTLPTDTEVFHADFMNGWDEGALENIINNCQPAPGTEPGDYNPPCNCDQFLTKKPTMLSFDGEGSNDAEAAKICPIDVKSHIVNEEINFTVGGLPRGSCSNPVINNVPPPFVDECGLSYNPFEFDEENCNANPVPEPAPVPAPVPVPTLTPVSSPTEPAPTEAPVPPPTSAPVPSPTEAPQPEPTEAPVPPPTSAPVPSPTESPLPAPTEAPVPAPTSAPVPSPTEPPQPAPTSAPVPEPEGECIDDPDLAYMDAPWKNCDWVAKKYFKRCFFEWDGAELWEYCPGACRECTCYDDDDLAYKRDPNKSCDWVADNLDRCDKDWKGHTLEFFCPVTCGVCEYDIEV